MKKTKILLTVNDVIAITLFICLCILGIYGTFFNPKLSFYYVIIISGIVLFFASIQLWFRKNKWAKWTQKIIIKL